MNDWVIIFSIIALVAAIGAGTCLIGEIISNRRWLKRARSADSPGMFTKAQMKRIKAAKMTPEFLNSKTAKEAMTKGADDALKTSDPEADLLKSIDNHLKHFDLSLAAIAIEEHDKQNDPLNAVKLGLLSSPHARYIAFMKTMEGKTHES